MAAGRFARRALRADQQNCVALSGRHGSNLSLARYNAHTNILNLSLVESLEFVVEALAILLLISRWNGLFLSTAAELGGIGILQYSARTTCADGLHSRRC